MVRARFGVEGGRCLSSVAAGRLCNRPSANVGQGEIAGSGTARGTPDRTGASSRGRRLAGWRPVAAAAVRQGVAGRATGRSRSNWASQPSLWQMQCEAARRAGDPSGKGEEPPPEGLGGHHLLAQTDARCPAGDVVGHHLYRQPGGVGGEASPRGDGSTPHRA